MRQTSRTREFSGSSAVALTRGNSVATEAPAVAAAVRRAVDHSGGELVMLVNDLAKAASMRSGGGSALQLAATEEEVRMRYLVLRIEQLCAEILAATLWRQRRPTLPPSGNPL